jgi:heptosyltransferase-2
VKQDFKNILVVRTDRIGDVVVSIPAMRAIKKAFPLARLTVWIDPSTRELVEGLSFVDDVIVEPRKAGWIGYGQFIATLKRSRFDLAVIYHTKRKTNVACWLAGIPCRLGYRNNKFGQLLNMPVEDRRHFGEKHEASFCLDLLKAIGVESDDKSLELPARREAELWAAEFWEAQSLTTRPVVAFSPDASCPTRRWPPELFARLAERLTNELGARVLIVGTRETRKIVSEIFNHFQGDAIDLTGELTMGQLVSLFRRCKLVISNDSGPAHIAAAVKAPVITIFMRDQPGINPGRWRPLGEKVVVVNNKPGEEIRLDRSGSVISGRFDSITPDEVFAYAKAWL